MRKKTNKENPIPPPKPPPQKKNHEIKKPGRQIREQFKERYKDIERQRLEALN